jgi:hypothetical protein
VGSSFFWTPLLEVGPWCYRARAGRVEVRLAMCVTEGVTCHL